MSKSKRRRRKKKEEERSGGSKKKLRGRPKKAVSDISSEWYKDMVLKQTIELAEAAGKQSFTDVLQTRDLCVGPGGFNIQCDVRTADGDVLPIKFCDTSDDDTDCKSPLRSRVNQDDIWYCSFNATLLFACPPSLPICAVVS